MIKQIAHIGIVVSNLEKARNFYNSILGLEASPPIAEEQFNASMVQVGDVKLELLAPVGSEGAVARFLEKRGEGIHHVCLEVDNIEAALESLAARGVELVDKKPRQGIEGKVAFLHPRSTYGVLIELVEKP